MVTRPVRCQRALVCFRLARQRQHAVARRRRSRSACIDAAGSRINTIVRHIQPRLPLACPLLIGRIGAAANPELWLRNPRSP